MRIIARVIYKLGDIIEVFVLNAGTVFLTGALLLGLTHVFLRKAFESGFWWIEEVFKYIVLWAVFLGSGLATRYMTHIKMDILVVNLKGKFQTVLIWSGLILGLVVSLCLLVLSIQYIGVLVQQKMTLALKIFPKWMANAAFTAATLTLSFYFLERIMLQVYPRERLGLPPLKLRGRER